MKEYLLYCKCLKRSILNFFFISLCVGLQVFCFVIVELRCKKLGEFQGVVKLRVSFSNSIAYSCRKSVKEKN